MVPFQKGPYGEGVEMRGFLLPLLLLLLLLLDLVLLLIFYFVVVFQSDEVYEIRNCVAEACVRSQRPFSLTTPK